MTISNSRQQLARWLDEKEGSQQQAEIQKYVERIRGKPFWLDVSAEDHKKAFKQSKGSCCAWHVFGCPVLKHSDGTTTKTPCWDFQFDIIKRLEGIEPYQEKQHALAICKSTNLGLSELLTVRWIAYRALVNDDWNGYTVAILTSPSLSLSVNMIARIRGLFPDIQWREKESQITLNSCRIFATPSHLGLPALRSWDRMACVVLEEFDHFNSRSEQEQAKNLSDRFFGKNPNFYSLIISTPSRPDFMLHDLERDSGPYQYLKLDYTYGLGKMFDSQAIEVAKRMPNFDQEYRCVFQGVVGNVFSTLSVDDASKTSYSLNPADYQGCGHKALGLDPGQHMAAVVLCYHNETGKIRCLYSKMWERPDYKSVFEEIWQDAIIKYNVKRCYIDASQPPVVAEFMSRYNDDCKPNYQDRIKWYESKHIDWYQQYHTIPVNFGESNEARTMLSNLKILVDNDKIQVHPTQKDLIVALRTAVTKFNYELDKSQSVNHHTLDACRLAAKEFRKSQ